jgi:hypothetical protein
MTKPANRIENALAAAAKLSMLSETQRKAALIAFLRHDMVMRDLQYFVDEADRTGSPVDPGALQVLLPAYEQSRRDFLTVVGENPDSDLLPPLMRVRPCNA